MAKFLKLSLGRKPEPDDDLDFPDFDFDNPETKDDRTPVSKAILSAKEGFTNALTDRQNISRKLKENLPTEYGEALDFVSNSVSETREFVDQSVKSLKPAVRNIAKSVKMFLPPGMTRIQDRIDKIEKWATEQQSAAMSVEAQRDQDISISIGRIFQQQALQEEVKEAKEDAKDKVSQAIEFGRHKDQVAILNAINKAVTTTSNYTVNINSEWQKKSLELQYRLLFATRDILQINTKFYEDSKTFLSNIQKNTALPEYQKLRLNERFGEQTRNKFIGKGLDTATGYIGRVKDNVKNEIKNSIDTIAGMSDTVATGADMAKTMEDFEGKKSLEQHAGKAGGGWLGNKILDFVIGKGAAKLKEDPKRLDKFSKITNKLGYLLENKDRLAQSAEDFSEEDPNIVKKYLGKFMRTFSGTQSVDTSIRRLGVDDMRDNAVFTNHVSKSITDIIPGYLAKILREITVLRTGDEKTSLVSYDFKRGRFLSENTLIRLNKRQFEKGNKSVENDIKPLLSIVEDKEKLEDSERALLSRFLIDYSMSGGLFSFKKFSDPQFYKNKLPVNLGEKVASAIQSHVEKIGPETAEYDREQRKIAKNFNAVSSSMTSSAKDAQDLVSFGQEHIARKAGMINRYGSYDLAKQKDQIANRIKPSEKLEERTAEDIYRDNLLDTDASDFDASMRQREYLDKMKEKKEENEETSDILAKENIKATSTKFLSKLKKLKLYDWNYKKSIKDDGGLQHTGPMAQNVNDVLGSEVAPGGTKIDMVNMNGFLTGATQELNDKVDNLQSSIDRGQTTDKAVPEDRVDYSIKLTEQIRDNTEKIASGTLLGLGFLGKLDLSKLNLSNLNIDNIVKESKDKFNELSDSIKNKKRWGYEYLKDGSAMSHIHGLINSALGAGQDITSLGMKAGTKLKELGASGADKIKKGAKWAWENPITKAGNWFKDKHDDIANSIDVFVRPEDAPRMLSKKIRRGDYVDSSNPSEPLKTKKDIENVKGDIVDTKTGQVVIYIGEIDNIYFRYNSTNKIIKAAKAALSSTSKGFGKLKGFVPVAYTFAWDIAKTAYKKTLNWIEGPTDVYVKGEEVPRLFKHAMIAGKYIRASDGKVIERPSQIDGMVYDINQEVVLSAQDFMKGIVNSKGQPFTGPIKKIINKARSITNFIKDKAIAGTTQALSGLKRVGQGVLNVAAHGLVGVSNIAGAGIGVLGTEGLDVLKSIRDILDARLPGGGGIGVGGVKHDEYGQEIAGPKNINKESSNKSILPSVPKIFTSGNSLDLVGNLASSTGSVAKGLWSKLRNKSDKIKESFDETEAGKKVKELKNKTTEEIEKLKHSTLAEKLKEKKDKLKNKITSTKEKVKARVGSWQNMEERENVNKSDHSKELNEVRKYEIRNTFDIIGDMIKGIKNKIGKFLNFGDDEEGLDLDTDSGREGKRRRRRKGSKIGRIKGAAKRLGGRVLGSRVGQLATGALSNVSTPKAGMLRTGASLAGRALMSTPGLLGRAAISGLAAIPGTVGAVTSAGTAMISGAGALIGSISLPVVAGIVAVGALAYGGYKLYKYLTTKKWNDTERLRMLEYGFRGGDEDAFKKVYALEKMLIDAATVTETDVSINNKKVEAKEIYKLFGIDPTSEDNEQMLRKRMFDTWYEQRFSPVFYKWLKAIQKVYGDKNIDKLEKDAEKQYKVVKETSSDNTGWTVPNSPFNLQNLNTDTNIISKFRSALLDKLAKEAKIDVKDDKKDEAVVEGSSPEVQKNASEALNASSSINSKEVSGQTQTVANKALSVIKNSFGYTPLGLMLTAGSKLKAMDAWFSEKVSSAMSLKLTLTSPKEFFSNVFGKSVSALEAIKMKTYGLNSMETTRVNTLRKLEELLIADTKFSSDNTITWDGDLQVLTTGVRKLFGISDEDVSANKSLLEYLSKRFIPTYLIFYTGVYSAIGKSDIKVLRQSIDILPSSASIEIGNRLIGSSEIWNVVDSPWTDYKLLTDSQSVKENLSFLALKAKSETLPEQRKVESKGISPKTTAGTTPEKLVTIDNNQTKNTGQTQKVNNDYVSPDAEGKEIGGATGGGKPVEGKTTSTSQSQLVMAGGELANGSGASKFITLSGGANITNMNPDFMKLFNGMVEEYGEKTGKKVQVNSGWRSMEAQAELYRKLPRGRAAKPGNSLHEFGLAMDVSPADLDSMDKIGLLRKYGFTRPIAKEPWHIEPVGINTPELLAAVKRDTSIAKTAIESSIGRGGGGVGDTQRNADRYYRDWKLHNTIFNSNVTPIEDKDKDPSTQQPSAGYAAGVDNINKNQVQLPSQKNNTSNLISSSEAELSATSNNSAAADRVTSATSTAENSGIVQPQKGFSTNSDNLETLKESTGSRGNTWKDLPNNNGASWKAQGEMIEQAAKWVGIDPGLAAAVAAKESGFNPTAMSKEASPNAARGMYQFKPDTFNEMVKKYGSKYGISSQNANIMDPRQSALMGMHYVKQGLSSAGGSSAGWAYLTHFLGQGGNLSKFKSMADGDIAAKILPGPAAANKPVFFHGGNVANPRTKAEIIAYCDNEMKRKLTEFKVPLSLGDSYQTKSDKATATDSKASDVKNAPIANAPIVDSSNPQSRESTDTTVKTDTNSGFGRFNSPTNDQVLAANQPIQKGSDPARDVKMMDETNLILSKQLNVMMEVRDLVGQILSSYNNDTPDVGTKSSSAIRETKEPSKVRQRDIPITTMSKPMVSRARTVV